MEDRIHPGKKFSGFLILTLTVFEGLSLALVMGLLYWMLSRSMTEEFLQEVLTQQTEAGAILHERMSRLESRVRELSLNNVVRVSLMLGVKSQLREKMEDQYPDVHGAVWLTRGKGGDFIPGLPGRLKDLEGFLTLLARKGKPGSARFVNFGDNRFLSVFYSPIMRKNELLGSAFVIYDLSMDSAYWFRLGMYHGSQLLIRSENYLIDLHTGGKYMIPKELSKAFSARKPVGSFINETHHKGILPLKGFPGIFYSVSSPTLHKEKIALVSMLAGICIVIFFLTFLVAVFIARKVGRPLEEMSNQALEIAQNPIALSLQGRGIRYREFRKLGQAFNLLIESLLQAHKKLTQRAEKKLGESEERYHKTLEATPLSISISRLADGRFMLVNDTFCKITGYSKEEILGETSHGLDLFINPIEREHFIGMMKEKGKVDNMEIPFRGKDGSILNGLLSGRLLQYENEDCLVAVFFDITDRKKAQEEKRQLEAQLRQAQKMEAIGTLAGGIAHDFNNLLQGILGYAQMLLMAKEGNDPDSSKLKQIERAAERASELTQQLLAFSRKVESRLRPVDLNEEVKQVEKLLKRTIPKIIHIQLKLEEKLRVVNADPAQLEQVMMNLGINARDAMPEGGELVIETENVMLDENYCKTHLGAKAGEYVLLSISDTGSGMDKETVDHIFEPFFTTKEKGKGTGLGLAMVYGIVKNHGGYIMCYSELGAGTSFKIYIPVTAAGTGADAAQPQEEQPDQGGGETILLVDDEEILLDLGKEMLGKFGYTVLRAHDGRRAIELFREKGDEISLVILDVDMPGMGGEQCLHELLNMNPEVKVVIASGYAAGGRSRNVLEAGAKAFVKKPYKLNQMLKVVRAVIDA